MIQVQKGNTFQRELPSLSSVSQALLTYYYLAKFAFPVAIAASLLLFATFGVGVRCFADFDKGLQSSKMHGQYYKPVATQLREHLFGN